MEREKCPYSMTKSGVSEKINKTNGLIPWVYECFEEKYFEFLGFLIFFDFFLTNWG